MTIPSPQPPRWPALDELVAALASYDEWPEDSSLSRAQLAVVTTARTVAQEYTEQLAYYEHLHRNAEKNAITQDQVRAMLRGELPDLNDPT